MCCASGGWFAVFPRRLELMGLTPSIAGTGSCAFAHRLELTHRATERWLYEHCYERHESNKLSGTYIRFSGVTFISQRTLSQFLQFR